MSALAVMLIAMGIADVVPAADPLRAGWPPVIVARRGGGLRGAVAGCGISATFRCWRSPRPQASAGSCYVPAPSESGEHQGAPLAVFGIAVAVLILLSGLGFRRRRPRRAVGDRGSRCPASAMSARTGC